MVDRIRYHNLVEKALVRSRAVALLGPRQCGKTTLARQFNGVYLDLESPADSKKLDNAELYFSLHEGLIILDEIQSRPDLFSVLRSVIDNPKNKCKFLILGSASLTIVKEASESLAGRVEFIDLSGFDIDELNLTGNGINDLWFKGGFPSSYLVKENEDSFVWRDNFIKTFLERDLPQLGINIPSVAMRRFWTMLAHNNAQLWNASALSASMGVSDKTLRHYLDLLTGTYMIRQLQPWYENIKKRQVKAPKVYFCDTGILHSLLEITSFDVLLGHPSLGFSWEAFAIEQILRALRPRQAYFWSTYSKAELDLLLIVDGKKYGFEFKFSQTPVKTRSMGIAMSDLELEKLFIVCPVNDIWPIEDSVYISSIRKTIDFFK